MINQHSIGDAGIADIENTTLPKQNV